MTFASPRITLGLALLNNKMNISGRAVVKSPMRPFVIIPIEVVAQTSRQSRYGGIPFDVDVLVLDGAPEALHEDAV